MPMHEEAIEIIKREEGYEAEPYMCSENCLTIGWGSRIDRITEEEAEWLLRHRANKMWDSFCTTHEWVPDLPRRARIALSSMVYQLGEAGVSGFAKMLKHMKAGDFVSAAEEALDSKWAIQTPARAQRTAALVRGAQEEKDNDD